MIKKISTWVFLLVTLVSFHVVGAAPWEAVSTTGNLTARHEAGLISYKQEIYLLGGRRVNPVNILNTQTLQWRSAAKTPLEMHHFQPVVWKNRIIALGAMTGGYPGEKPLANIYYYYPERNSWEKGPEIPQGRRRGGAGVVVDGDKLYLVGGSTNGHINGYTSWFDVYDLGTKTWAQLADAPHKRDHFQAAIIGGKIYVAGGRRTSQITGEVFNLLVADVDVYDISSKTWSSLKKPLPTPRAGNSTFALSNKLYVVGGESARPSPAHNEVEVYDPATNNWSTESPLVRGRHGTGLGIARGYLWTASGSGNQGGAPELNSTERTKVSASGRIR